MTGLKARFGFCAALAVIAAALADPIVESASNAGWFGRGSFTDHSNLDIVPALLAGVALMALYFVRRASKVLAGGDLPKGAVRLLPTVFALQILTLCGMETAEQMVVWGHLLGPTVWLGAPWAISLAIHAATSVAVTLCVARSARALAVTTLRVIRFIRAIATLAPHVNDIPVRSSFDIVCFKDLAPVSCRIGKRAPPAATA